MPPRTICASLDNVRLGCGEPGHIPSLSPPPRDHEDLNTAFSEGIFPALKDSGYTAVRVDRVQHNDKIDDKIIAEIRRSGLDIADFTGSKGGVYYEAGFAHGLGLPVIFTVREDDVSRLHFDTRQYNHIVWETPAHLRELLHDRVAATLGSPELHLTL